MPFQVNNSMDRTHAKIEDFLPIPVCGHATLSLDQLDVAAILLSTGVGKITKHITTKFIAGRDLSKAD